MTDAEAFQAAVAPHAQVKAILCGHAHQAFATRRAVGERSIPVYGCPSVTDPFLPGSETFAVDATVPPGFRVLDLDDDRLMTRVERVDISK